MNLEQMKALIEAEALTRQASRDGFTLEAVESFLGKGLVMPPELAAEPPPLPDKPALSDFMALNGRLLVSACYLSLLGRTADAAGMSHFMTQLAKGMDKAIVVGSIAYSREARARGVSVRGLAPRFAIAMASRVPVAGALVQWVVAFATLHSRMRQVRALEHEMHVRMDAMGRYVKQSSAQVAIRLEALRTVLESRD